MPHTKEHRGDRAFRAWMDGCAKPIRAFIPAAPPTIWDSAIEDEYGKTLLAMCGFRGSIRDV